MNLFTKQKQTHRLRECPTVTRGERCGGGKDWKVGITMHPPLCLKRITKKDLLHSTRDSAQYSVITYVGRKSGKE